MRNSIAAVASVLACGFAIPASSTVLDEINPSSVAENGLQIEIQSPSANLVTTPGEATISVEGVASTIGGVRYLDMIFVMDTSSRQGIRHRITP